MLFSRYTIGLSLVWLVVIVLLAATFAGLDRAPELGQLLLAGVALILLGAASYGMFRWMLADVQYGYGAEWGRRERRVHQERDQLRLQLRNATLQREQLERQLFQSRNQTRRLREVFQQLNHPAAFLDAFGVILDLNMSISDLSGVLPSELIGRKIQSLPMFPQSGRLAEALARAAEGSPGRLYLELKSQDQRLHNLHVSLKPVAGDSGRVEVIILEGHDVTEQLRAEQALQETFHQFQQSQKMEAIGRLAGGIAHDFNNLLTSILGFSNMALESIRPEEEAHEDLQEVVLSATRAQNLTQKLLALSRKDVPDSQPVDLSRLIQGMENLLRITLHENIELVLEDLETPCVILADPTSMEQVILNLAVNARDAMPRSGRLLISTGKEKLDRGAKIIPELLPGAYRFLRVRDTGCGMGPEVLDHIFEPFFTTKREGQGTGLGLSTVYAIVKQAGGGIWIESEPGQGTEFRLYFPQHDAMEQLDLGLTVTPDKTPLPRGTETILLVEDEEGVRRMVSKVFDSLGYTLLVAADGEEGVRVAEAHPERIDLIITDVVMPNLSGPEMIDQLRLSLGYIPHLYVSGFTMDKLREHGADGSEQFLIRKPYSREQLAQRVRQALDQAANWRKSRSGASPQRQSSSP